MIILGMMQVSKKIPFDDPQVLMSIRGIYIFSNVVIAVVYLVLQSRINSKKGKTLLPLYYSCKGRSFTHALKIIESTRLIQITMIIIQT